MYIYISMYICVYYICIYVYMYIYNIYVYLFICIYIYRYFLVERRFLSGIQFTKHVIKFAVVETKQFVGGNINVILTWHMCGWRSCMSAGCKHRALAFHFYVRNCHILANIKM